MSNFVKTFSVNNVTYKYYSIKDFCIQNAIDFDKIPFSIKILLENILRNYGSEDALRFVKHDVTKGDFEFFFKPCRVLMQDFTGVPAVVDLAAMRYYMEKIGKNPELINPICKTDLVIDHSIQVDDFGNKNALKNNEDIEFERNKERYAFLKWAQNNFRNLRIVPPGKGICHQINIEYLADVVVKNEENELFFDTVVGTDSHTTMINALGVLGWGVGGIEAESVMLNQPISMIKPEVIGVKLIGKLNPTLSSMDLSLHITNVLRKFGVVNKFVEFFGEGVSSLSLADRATISNMTPEFGATCSIFQIDDKSIDYLNLTGRESGNVEIVKRYAEEQGIFGVKGAKYNHEIEINLSEISVTMAGPKRPQDKVSLSDVPKSFVDNFGSNENVTNKKVENGSVVIAAITSCTNTSNPKSLITAGLIAKKAVELGLSVPDFVKTSFSPGSLVVSGYMEKSGLQEYLDKLRFNVAGFGCMTCIGNSGALSQEIENEITKDGLCVSAVISGNRNFEGRVHNLVKSNYLASPAMVVIYALSGNVLIDIEKDGIMTKDGKKIKLHELMPSNDEVESIMSKFVNRELFIEKYNDILTGGTQWQGIELSNNKTYSWKDSTYIQNPPYFEEESSVEDIKNARILGVFGDSITTDHISPAGNISIKSDAAKYLIEKGIEYKDFNSYGARRGAHEVMMRGTFGNVRLKNLLLDGIDGSFSVNLKGETASFYEVAMENKKNNLPSVIFGRDDYGCGSSRDWAAKGTKLLGIKAVIANSFERIHRSNLAGMGVLPIQIKERNEDLDLKNATSVDIIGINSNIQPKKNVECIIYYRNGNSKKLNGVVRLDTNTEIEYFKKGSIFHYIIDSINSDTK